MALQKFAFPLEDNSRPIPMAPINNWNARLATPDGTVANATLTLPAGARMIRVASLSADVYVVAAKTTPVAVTIPTGNVTDGSAPDLVPAGGSEMFVVAGLTKLTLVSTGDVYVTAYA